MTKVTKRGKVVQIMTFNLLSIQCSWIYIVNLHIGAHLHCIVCICYVLYAWSRLTPFG